MELNEIKKYAKNREKIFIKTIDKNDYKKTVREEVFKINNLKYTFKSDSKCKKVKEFEKFNIAILDCKNPE